MIDAATIAKSLKGARQTNNGWEACCPIHNDKSPSLSISDGKDGKILIHCHGGCGQRELVAYFKGQQLWPQPEREDKPKPAKGKGKIVKTYQYFSHLNGDLVMEVCRMEPKDFRQRRPGPDGKPIWGVPAASRTLYNAVRAYQHDKVILVVEGEKDVDNLAELGIVAVCNPGGAGKWQDNYSEILRGKDVVIVPDNDQPGENHAQVVGAALHGIAKRVRVLRLPGLPDKGDVSDWLAAGGDRKKLGELLAGAVEFQIAAPAAADPQFDDDLPEAANDNDEPFIHLGHNRGTFYYLDFDSQQVTELSAGGHTKSNLIALAPLTWWEMNFPGERGFSVDMAINAMMRRCYKRGIFTKDMVRGRGAWLDRGQIVLHCGDRLYVDRTPMAPTAFRGQYVYELGAGIKVDIDNPLPVSETKKFLELVRMLPLSRDLDAVLLAGWCALAWVGGVLRWRPHIWITGGKGSGKSYTMESLIKPILGDQAIFVAGSTTEAGIRQKLEQDAIPVMFDEAEGQDHAANQRLQKTLELVRQSSSETGAKIVKGSAGNGAQDFQIRSCFVFSSINASLVQESDKSRITVLELKKECQKHNLETLDKAFFNLITSEYAERFRARSIAQSVTIRENARTFSQAAARLMGEQRAGDQYGSLFAGAWSLQSDDLVTYEQASDFISQFDLSQDKVEVEGMSDELKLLDTILQSKIEIVIDDKVRRMPVSEVVPMAGDDNVFRQLQSEGIKVVMRSCVDNEGHTLPAKVFIANGALGVKRMLKDTPWESADYTKVLRRLPNAEVLAAPTRMGNLGLRRGVIVELP